MNSQNNIKKRRLLRGHEFSIDCHDDDGKWFVELFRSTWRLLPLSVRRAILKFWRHQNTTSYLLIELSNLWAPENSFGQVGCNGKELKFRQKVFSRIPPRAARWLIAHELAHVFQKACGRRPGGEDELENEDHADGLVKEWGIDDSVYILLDIYMTRGQESLLNACEILKKDGFYNEI